MDQNRIICFFLLYFMIQFLLVFGSHNAQATTEPLNIIVFDHTYANWDHPAEIQITIPNGVLESGWVNITAYCDPDDCYVRAIYFSIDNRGGWIGTSALSPSQVDGDLIFPGDTVSRNYNLSSTQFANEETWSGSVTYDFLNQTNGSVGFLTPGLHTIKAFVSSQDICLGETQDSWISVTLEFNGTFSQSSGGGGGGGSNTQSSNQSTNQSSDQTSEPLDSNFYIIIIIAGSTAVFIMSVTFMYKKRAKRFNLTTNEKLYRPN